ncbi:Conserved_hypothetical protein [Hexamita inflata]|uniref:Uncharacterized protein n=1 Tax=Hexamita inflata TaxID=28002 RepID=A0AA86QSQ3_9EUKA|nr:Conserved hypothetical protein [Hexamita inflata]
MRLEKEAERKEQDLIGKLYQKYDSNIQQKVSVVSNNIIEQEKLLRSQRQALQSTLQEGSWQPEQSTEQIQESNSTYDSTVLKDLQNKQLEKFLQDEKLQLEQAQQELYNQQQQKIKLLNAEQDKIDLLQYNHYQLQKQAEQQKLAQLELFKQQKQHLDLQKMKEKQIEVQKQTDELNNSIKAQENELKNYQFHSQRKFVLRELDKELLKMEEVKNKTQKANQIQIQQQIESNVKLLNEPEPKKEIIKEYTEINPMQIQPREQYKTFLKIPEQKIIELKELQIQDPDNRLQTRQYTEILQIEALNMDLESTLQSSEQVNEYIEQLNTTQQYIILNLENILQQQKELHSPAIQQIQLILQLESQITTCTKFCKCIGDIKFVSEFINTFRNNTSLKLVDQIVDQQLVQQLIQGKVLKCKQQGYIIQALLHEQIDKGNKQLDGIKRLLLLNEEYEMVIQQQETLDKFNQCSRMYERVINAIDDLQLIE